jgi:hypothetical protein
LAPPALAEEPAAPAPEAYATDSTSGEDPSLDAAGTAPTDDAARIVEPYSSKTGETENAIETDQFQVGQEASPLVPSTWQIALVVIALLGLLFMFFMRYTSARRWK